MRKHLLPVLILALCLSACAQAHQPTEPVTVPTEPTLIQTEPQTVPPTDPPTEPPTVPVTEPEHSKLSIPGLSVEDVILYFNEVCLDAEFSHSGDFTKLQKWVLPISYCVHGDPTDEDLAVLADFTAWLNTIEGFPGIHETDDPTAANLRIHFTDQQGLLDIMGSDFTGLDGAVTFWYTDDEIYDADICILTDLDQELRNSVILEELYNGLGPIQDTALREDSIIYSEFSQPQSLTETDELILKLLYHPDIRCGMDAAECEAVIRQLYD